MSRGRRLDAEDAGRALEDNGAFGVGQAVRAVGVVCLRPDSPSYFSFNNFFTTTYFI